MRDNNIFLVDGRLKAEDRLTYSWAYVLNTVPGLGQRFADWIGDRAGLGETTFRTAIDHPAGTARDRPDFQLRCDNWSMLFEHKLYSGLGVAQLERYLEYATDGRRNYLGLVTPRLVDVSPAVVRHRRYKRPMQRKHFLWQDFFPLIQKSRGKLARDFAEYLGASGVKPWQWGSIGDPFTDRSADAALRTVCREVGDGLRAPGGTSSLVERLLGSKFASQCPACTSRICTRRRRSRNGIRACWGERSS
jgi:hypothetical protein